MYFHVWECYSQIRKQMKFSYQSYQVIFLLNKLGTYCRIYQSVKDYYKIIHNCTYCKIIAFMEGAGISFFNQPVFFGNYAKIILKYSNNVFFLWGVYPIARYCFILFYLNKIHSILDNDNWINKVSKFLLIIIQPVFSNFW